MATLRITEYAGVGQGLGGTIQAPKEPAVARQALSFTTSAASNAFNDATRLVRLYSATACYVVFGDAPTATTSHEYLPGGETFYFAVTPGQKVAAYDGSS